MLELGTVQWSRERKAAQVVHQGHTPVKPALSCLHFTLAGFVPFVLSVHRRAAKAPPQPVSACGKSCCDQTEGQMDCVCVCVLWDAGPDCAREGLTG